MWTILESSADKTAHLPEFDEPLILGGEPRAPLRWKKALAYFAGCLALAICLLAQLLIYYQDYFLRHAQWRPLIASVCSALACELPAARNAAALRSVFLSVDPHPEYQNMLTAKFRVQNTAMYPQAFPSVELSFSNTDNELIAERRFYPGHYLALAQFSERVIAAGAEIDGTLTIRDPGDDAVNYKLGFVYENN
jgi:hypothetical protein